MKSLKITALSLVLVLLLAACGAKNDTPDEPAVDPTPEPPIEQPVEKTPDERINDIIADMSIEEKVGQLFFVRCPETARRRTSKPITSAACCSSAGTIRMQTVTGSPRTTSPRRSRLIRPRQPFRFSSAAMKRAARSRARAKIRTSSPNSPLPAGALCRGRPRRAARTNAQLQPEAQSVRRQRELRPRVRCADESRQLHLRALVRAGRADDRGLYLKRRARLCAVRYRLRLKALPRLRQQRRHAHGHRARRAPVHHV